MPTEWPQKKKETNPLLKRQPRAKASFATRSRLDRSSIESRPTTEFPSDSSPRNSDPPCRRMTRPHPSSVRTAPPNLQAASRLKGWGYFFPRDRQQSQTALAAIESSSPFKRFSKSSKKDSPPIIKLQAASSCNWSSVSMVDKRLLSSLTRDFFMICLASLVLRGAGEYLLGRLSK